MTEPGGKSEKDPTPAVPGSGEARRSKETEEAQDSEILDATIVRPGTSKAIADKPQPDEPDGLNATIVKTGSQQIPGLVLVEELGRGGMGVVYRGKQEFLDREVAVKMLLEQRKNPEYAARFKREAKILAGLQHPHIVTCYQADVTADGVCFLVMEFVKGPNLREHLFEKGPLAVTDALLACRNLASALACAHEKKIIHRDVKSENVLLAPESKAAVSSSFRYQVKLTDLGLARPETCGSGANMSFNLTLESAIMGTPASMSPEQFDDPQGVDHRTDIYGLGCVLYDALITKPPFKGSTLSSLILAKRQAVRGPDPRLERPDLDAEVAELVMRMLAAAREDRPQTYAELLEICDRLIEKLGGTRGKTQAKRNRRGMYAAIGIVGVVAGVGTWMALRDKGEPQIHGPGPKLVDTTPPTPPPAVFGLKIEPVLGAEEGKLVKLVTTATGVENSAAVKITWNQLDGPHVSLLEQGSEASFIAPRATKPYELSFRASGAAAGGSAQSEITRVAVDARDDPPTVKIDGVRSVTENGRVTLTARIDDPDQHGEFSYVWTRTRGPLVQITPNANPLSFSAPEALAPYDIVLGLQVRSGETVAQSKAVVVEVSAVNDPPSVLLKAPDFAEVGKLVEIETSVTDVDSLASLSYQWLQLDPKQPAVVFEPANGPKTKFTAPENAGGDYTLKLALLVTDLDEPAAQTEISVQVQCDATLAPLAKKEQRDWTFDPTNHNLGDWTSNRPEPDLKPGVGQFQFRSMGTASWISHAIPRGRFVLDVQFEEQSVATVVCGLRIVCADNSGLSFCFVPEGKDGARETRRFIAYKSTMDASGVWPGPPTQGSHRLGPWSIHKPMQLELSWNGTQLTPRWRDATTDAWVLGSTAFTLESRPISASFFVENGQIGVSAVSIQGL